MSERSEMDSEKIENSTILKSADADENSSSDSVVEIKLNDFVKKSELTKLDIRSFVVKCSSCASQINHVYHKVKKHRKLGVLTCQSCYEFYGSSEFSQDENGYNYCSWCGNGGKLFVCDFCPNGFCASCIRRNFGRSEISKTMQNGWKCYVCDSAPLKAKQKFCDVIIDFYENGCKAGKEKKTFPKNELTEKWLQASFDNCSESCKTFHHKLNRLKKIGMSNSKSLKHIVSKMEQILSDHRKVLKSISKSVSDEYLKYIESKKMEDLKQIDFVNGDSEVEPSEKGLSRNIAESADNDNVIEETPEKLEALDKENPPSKSNSLDDTVIEELPEKCQTVDIEEDSHSKLSSIDERNLAKMALLMASSDSEAESIPQEGNSIPPAVIPEPTPVNDVPDPKTAKRLLLFSSESEASNDFNDVVLKTVKKLTSKSQEKDGSLLVVDLSDEKLQLHPIVKLRRWDGLLQDGCYRIEEDQMDDLEKLDKDILRLCKSPTLTKESSKRKYSTSFKPKHHKACANVDEGDSSSSIILSSGEDEDDFRPNFPPFSTKACAPFSQTKTDPSGSDSSISQDSVIELETKKNAEKEKSSNAKKVVNNSGDSSDDFQPPKRRKYDKLLDAPLLSTAKKNDQAKPKKEKATRKKRLISSDENSNDNSKKLFETSSSESDEELRKKSNKKRRIKSFEDSSDEEKSAKEDTPNKGRKNIKKIISEDKQAKSTKEAQMEEKERRKRIEERQKLYNRITDATDDGMVITKKMVLEVDKNSKEEIVEIHPDLVCKLKPHQVNGVKFMWECTIESVEDLDKPGSGCILAHCMGLGKTLQVIAFVHTCLTNPIVGKKLKRAMVICPYNVCYNWATEFENWLQDVENEILVHQLTDCGSNLDRYEIMKYWFSEGGVVILSYDIFRKLASDKIPKLKAHEKQKLHTFLLDSGPDLVICDEGHILKNENSAISKATAKLRTRRRIVLTGTPLQNNLKEYHCMVQFVKPSLLGTAKEFRNRFVNPVENGQHADSSLYDVKLMKKRIHILHKLLEGCVQRCDYRSLTKFLPPKHEYVISVKLSDVQIKMYECYLEKLTTAKKDGKFSGNTLFVDFNNLRCIWNHPFLCHVSHQKQEFKRLMKEDKDDDFINDASEEESKTSESKENSDDEVIITHQTRSRGPKDDDEEERDESEITNQWYHEFISDEDRYNLRISGKMLLLVDILRECELIGDKIIVFSQSLLTLNAIEDFLEFLNSNPDTEQSQDIIGKWVKGIDYFRMDGTTNAGFRKSYIQLFNDPANLRARLFLISTKAGSLGTNLIGANRVVIFDTSWNPSHDVQAIFRVYRFGQTKPVYIYRFLAQGTMEEKIYDRQVTKLSLSCRVVDEQQIERHFNASDLAELYRFDVSTSTNRHTPMVPKDRLLAEMLIKNSEWITGYHEHDSLLQNQTEEDLTEEERQAAWAEYENEREGKMDTFDQNVSADGSQFFVEPDFNEADYQGKKIPDLGVIMKSLYVKLEAEMPEQNNPLNFRKKLYAAVFRVRQIFQEKHVKFLRVKQECMQKQSGTVPNSVNKFLEELTHAIKSTGDYISKLKQSIDQEEAKLRLSAHMAKLQGVWNANIRNASFIRHFTAARGPQPAHIHLHQVPKSFVPQNLAPNISNRPAMFRNYSKNSRVSVPTVEEADDNAPVLDAPGPSNTTSSVVIEEIT